MHLARQSKSNVAQAIVEPANGHVLFSGKIHSVSRKVADSLTQGACVIRSEEGPPASGLQVGTDDDDEFLELMFTNEFSAAVLKTRSHGEGYTEKYLAASPDLITVRTVWIAGMVKSSQ
jgi:DUF917 family protein